MGRARPGQGAARPDSGSDRRRSGRRLLRHGRIVRLRARAFRRVARDRRAPAAARRAQPRRRIRPRRERTSCRHQVADFTGVRALHPAELLQSLLGRQRMNLAVISVCALALAVIVSCVSRLNVGVLAVALAWIVGVYIGGMPVNTVMSGFPSQLFLTLTGVTLLFALAAGQRHARAASRITPSGSAAATAARSRSCSSCSASALASMGPGNIATAALLAPLAMATAARVGIPLFLMAIMVGNGANSGALSPFAPTGIIVNGIMARNGLAGSRMADIRLQPSCARACRVRRLRAVWRPEAVPSRDGAARGPRVAGPGVRRGVSRSG